MKNHRRIFWVANLARCPVGVKTRFLILLLLHLSVASLAQPKKASRISGTILEVADQDVSLYVTDAIVIKIHADKNGRFNKLVEIDTATYVIFDGSFFYMKPNKDLIINKIDSTMFYAGSGATENTLIGQTDSLTKNMLPLEGGELPPKYSKVEPKDFFKLVDEYKAAIFNLLSTKKGLDLYFVRSQTNSMNAMARLYTLLYSAKYGIDPENEKKRMALLKTLTPENIKEKTPELIALSQGMIGKTMSREDLKETNERIWANFDPNDGDLYRFCTAYKQMADAWLVKILIAEYSKPGFSIADKDRIKFDVIARETRSGYVRERMLYDAMNPLLMFNVGNEEYYLKYLSLAKNKYFLSNMKINYARAKLLSPGNPAPKFSYVDIKGRSVSLDDFKGNYLYIDIWATWCGPCIAENPSLTEIEQIYEGKIKFIGISIDQRKDALKWKNFVARNRLGGSQLMADDNWNSSFIKAFNIGSIPRFLIIDPDGKIVSSDAPRPSNPKLTVLLDGLLKNR